MPTPESLANAALAYVAKFAATETSLRRVLTNRIRKAALAHPALEADAAAMTALETAVEALVEKHRRMGSVDDASYAAMKAGSLRRAGRSRRFIRQKLAEKGVGAELAQTALDRSDAERGADEAELAAALHFARRKRLGRFRGAPGPLDEPQQRKQAQRDLAALARNGFALDVARRALGLGRDAENEAFED